MLIKQGKKNTRSYVIDFNKQLLLSRSGLNEGMKMTIFRNGLSAKLQDKLIRTDCTSINDLQSHAVKISDQIYRMELHTKGKTYSHSSTFRHSSRSTRERSRSSSPDSDVMESIEYTGKSRQRRLSNRERDRRREKRCCYNCGEKGHIASNCQNKFRASRPKERDSKKLRDKES